MSVKVSAWVFDCSEATGNDRLVLLALADRADEYGYCWPGIADIARKARVCERTAQRSLSALVDLKELDIPYRTGGSGKSNRYQVLMEKGCQPVTLSGDEKGDNPDERVTIQAEKGDTGVTRTIIEPSLEPPLSARSENSYPANQNQVQDLIGWIETECSRLAIRPGFHTTSPAAKRALRDADSPELRSAISHILGRAAGMQRNVTSLISGLVNFNGQAHRGPPAPQRRKVHEPFERAVRPERESPCARVNRVLAKMEAGKL